MAYDIGPKIGIKGEKEFNDQIKRIDNNIKEYGSEMDLLTQKFGKNAKSQEALTEKSKVLKKEYDEQEKKSKLLQTQYDKEVKKLKDLADAVEQAKKENGEGSAEALKAENAFNKQAESVSKLKVSMNTTQGYMEKLKKEIDENNDALKRTTITIEELSEKTGKIGTGLTKGLTVPLAAGAAGAVAAFKEIDAGLDIIVEKTGAAGESLDEMKSIMEDMATTIPTDFETAGTAIGEVNTRFKLTGKDLEDLSTKFVKFAKINDADVTGSIDNVQKVMAAFNLTAEDADGLLDTLTATGQNTGISMDNLTSLMVTNAAALQQMGFDAYSAATFLGDVEMSGADVSQVMSGLTKALANATESGKPLDEALKELQGSMVNASSETEGLQIAYDLFGKRAGAAIYQACKTGTLSFEDLSTSAADNFGALDKTFENTLDPIDKFQTTANELKITGAEVGTSLLEVLGPALEKIRDVLKTLTDKWRSLSPETQDAIIKFALIAATVGPVVVLFSKFLSAISGIKKIIAPVIAKLVGMAGAEAAVGTAGAAGAAGTAAAGTAAGGAAVGFGALNVSILPIAGIILGIVAAVTAVIAIFKNWGKIVDWFKEHVGPVIEKVKDFFGGLGKKVGEIKDKVVGKVKEMAENVKNKFNDMKNKVAAKWDELKTAAKEKWESIKETVSSKVSELKEKAVNKWEEFKTATKEKWQGIKDAVSGKLEEIKTKTSEKLGNIKNAYEEAGGGIKGVAAGFMEGVKGVFESKFDLINKLTGGKLEELKNKFSMKLGTTKDTVTDGMSKIKDAISKTKLQTPEIKIPKVKLPHFKISGSFSFNPLKVPKLSIEWYKEGGILSGAQIFGTIGNKLLGGGESGPEAVLPLNSFYGELKTILAEAMSGAMPDYSDRNPGAMEVKVYVGNEEFKSYVVKTSQKGIIREIKRSGAAGR